MREEGEKMKNYEKKGPLLTTSPFCLYSSIFFVNSSILRCNTFLMTQTNETTPPKKKHSTPDYYIYTSQHHQLLFLLLLKEF